MRRPVFRIAAGLVTAAVALGAHAQTPTYTVVASGLEAPRGLKFGPDGVLYVAEAGTGGTTDVTTAKACLQVPPPVGPYTGSNTGRISKIVAGKAVTVASGFPSAQNAGGDLLGVADIAFLNGQLYALIAGGGCSHGHSNPQHVNMVAQVDLKSGHWQMYANLSAFYTTHSTKFENKGDLEVDGTPYSLIAHNGELVVVEANHGEIDAISQGGVVRRLIDISADEGHIVPTSVAEHGTELYVGDLYTFPIVPGSSRVMALSNLPDHLLAPGFSAAGWRVIDSRSGFTTVLGVAFGPDGLLYVLELSDQAGFPGLGQGKVVRLTAAGVIETVVSGLNVPGGIAFGPDSSLYVSDFSAVPAPTLGVGRILKFAVPPAN